MQRYKIKIEYEGTSFVGWQFQKNGQSIQEVLQKAIFNFSNEKVVVIGAGRTESGVHALGQIAHFDLKKKMTRKILYKQWLSEDGGRLNKKRNLLMILEIPEKSKLKIPKDFIWMSMWQIKECLKYNAWVNPHVRGLISCL